MIHPNPKALAESTSRMIEAFNVTETALAVGRHYDGKLGTIIIPHRVTLDDLSGDIEYESFLHIVMDGWRAL